MSMGISRRDFMRAGVGGACGVCFAGLGLPAWGKAEEKWLRKSPYAEKLEEGRVRCLLCPKGCVLAEGRRGICGVRENRGGDLYTVVFGRACTVHDDPIEKKPFFHYLPGTKALSIATAGCNFDCKFCQNWSISQAKPEEVRGLDLFPEKVVGMAKRTGSPTIAYTYTEPVVFTEYMYETAALGRERGVGNVMISNGYIREQPMRDLCGVLSAVKIDLKAFTETFYRDICAGDLKPVLRTLDLLKEEGMWTEIVVLIVPTLNDSTEEIRSMARWIREHLGPEVPVHYSRYHPTYKIRNIPPTPIPTLVRCRKVAMEEGLHYVYAGNVPGHPGEQTYCPGCGALLIKRTGYAVFPEGLDLKEGKCKKCGRPIPGVWTKDDVYKKSAA